MLQCVEHAPLKVVVSIMIRYCENCPAPCSALRHQSINMVHTVCCQWLATDAAISNCKRSFHSEGSIVAQKVHEKRVWRNCFEHFQVPETGSTISLKEMKVI